MRPLQPFPLLLFLCVLHAFACETQTIRPADGGIPPTKEWQIVMRDLPGALYSAWARNNQDVYVVGGDSRDGMGPTLLHFDGQGWRRIPTTEMGNMWWVFGLPGSNAVYTGGQGGMILRITDGTYTRMPTPNDRGIVFGIWGTSENDLWAVGGGFNTDGFIWHYDGVAWTEQVLPWNTSDPDDPAVYKVFGFAPNEVYFCGENGLFATYNGTSLQKIETGITQTLFTLSGKKSNDPSWVIAVGGAGNAAIIELNPLTQLLEQTAPMGAIQLNGIHFGLGPSEAGHPNGTDQIVAVGNNGRVFRRNTSVVGPGGWTDDVSAPTAQEFYHGVFVDNLGEEWITGGLNPVQSTGGILVHHGKPVSTAFNR